MYGTNYNKNLRKLVVAFGTLFSDIRVKHANSEDGQQDVDIRVPITYASQEKFIQRLLQPSSITDATRIENQLPRMSYIMNAIAPDGSRRRNRNTPLRFSGNADGVCDGNDFTIYSEIPVNIGFTLFLYTRHIDDTLQIVEQIMPLFNPDHIISMDFTNYIRDVRIPITMVSNVISDRYDGDLSNRRINISSFNFSAKSYIFSSSEATTGITSIGLTAGIGLSLFGGINE
jgi:hypothetical protein